MTCPQSTQSRVRTDLVSSGDGVGSLGLSAGSLPLGREAAFPRSGTQGRAGGGHTHNGLAAHRHTHSRLVAHRHMARRMADAGHTGGQLAALRAAGMAHGGVGLGAVRAEDRAGPEAPSLGQPSYPGCGVLATRHPGVFLVAACCLSSSSPTRVSSWGFQWQ